MNSSAIARFRSRLAVSAMVVGLTASISVSAFAERTVRLDAGSVIPVRLNDKLSSSESQKGDTFTATVRSGDSEDWGLPEGTKVDGTVTGARPQRDKDPGVIEVSFQKVRLPDGHTYPIEGSLIGLDNKSVDRRSDGRLIAKPGHKNDRLTYAGYGAGAGLIVGLLTKRPLEDAILGGLLGYGFSALQKGQSDARDVVLKPGTELGVRIDRQATFTSYNESQNSPRYHETDTPRDRDQGDRDRTDERRTDPYLRDRDQTDVGVMIDDRNVRFESTAQPIINRNDVVLVPLVPVLRAAKVPYSYDSRTQSVRATGTPDPVRLAVGSNIAVQGGRRVRLEGTVQRLNGTLYVPMKALALATGYDAHFDTGSKTVVLTPR